MNITQLPRHENKMGTIQMILESCEVGSISRICSLPNSWRARHTHPTDSHYCEVITGSVEYYERKTNSNEKPTKNTYIVGDIFYTPPGHDHEMIFNEFTIFNCYSRLSRTTENYEKETMRFPESLKEIYTNWDK